MKIYQDPAPELKISEKFPPGDAGPDFTDGGKVFATPKGQFKRLLANCAFHCAV